MVKSLIIVIAFTYVIFAQVDTLPRKWHVGYEKGISLRYFPQGIAFGYGILLQPQGSTLYSNSETDRGADYYNKSKRKGVQLLAETFYRVQIQPSFLITPFISLGGNYSTYNSTQAYLNFIDSSKTYSRDTRSSKQTSKSFIGQIGVMPGFEFGRFLFEFRLGVSGYLSQTKNSHDFRDAHYRSINLIYPSDIVQSLIIHFTL